MKITYEHDEVAAIVTAHIKALMPGNPFVRITAAQSGYTSKGDWSVEALDQAGADAADEAEAQQKASMAKYRADKAAKQDAAPASEPL